MRFAEFEGADQAWFLEGITLKATNLGGDAIGLLPETVIW